jgi:hypothetical protein
MAPISSDKVLLFQNAPFKKHFEEKQFEMKRYRRAFLREQIEVDHPATEGADQLRIHLNFIQLG